MRKRQPGPSCGARSTAYAAFRNAAHIVIALTIPAIGFAHPAAQHGFHLVPFSTPLPAPDFRVSGPEGGVVALSQLRGRHVLLNFWATWCPPCVQEMPSMERLHNRLHPKGLVVLAVAQDAEGAAPVVAFTKRLGLTFSIALDPGQAVGAQFGVRALPSTFLIDARGRVIAAAQGALEWDAPGAIAYFEELLGAAAPAGAALAVHPAREGTADRATR